MNCVTRIEELKLLSNSSLNCFSIPLSQLEVARWNWPMVVAPRDEKGYELMSKILQPLRGSQSLSVIHPSTMENKWKYALLPIGSR